MSLPKSRPRTKDKDNDKDKSFKAKAKAKDLTRKAKDFCSVLKDRPRPRTNITGRTTSPELFARPTDDVMPDLCFINYTGFPSRVEFVSNSR